MRDPGNEVALFLRLSVPSNLVPNLVPRVAPTHLQGKSPGNEVGVPSTLLRHENETFRKRSLIRRNLKTLAFCFRVDGKHFENDAFWKRSPRDDHVSSLTEFSLETNPKWPLIVAFSIPSGIVWYGFSEWNLRFKKFLGRRGDRD